MVKKVKVSRFSAGNEPSPNSGKYALYALAALVILIAGFALGKVTTSSKTSVQTINNTKKTSIGQVENKYGPKKVVGIVPVGFKHSTEGAVTAATSYVGLTPKLYFANDTAFNTSVFQITTTEFAQDFIDGIATNRATARDVYKKDPGAFFREIPLGYYLISEDKDSVKVGIWSEVLLAASPDFDGKTESKVHIIDLVWSNNDWKVNKWVTTAGPSPRWQAPASSLVTVDEFKKFVDPLTGGYDYVPSF